MDQDKRAAWESLVARAASRSPERKDTFVNASEIEIERLYTPNGNETAEYHDRLGYPGQFPYTRGIQPTMYRGRLWTMRQYAGFGTAQATNERFRYLLEQGQTGLSVAFDLPTQIGYDADHAFAQGEVGKVGVSISSLEDMRTLFDQIRLDEVSTSMTINAPASVLLAMYLVVAEEQGVPWDQVRGTIQNDILKEYVARGTYIYPPKPSMRIITDIFSFCKEAVPKWNTISISGYHIREAGSTAVQEIAFTLANAIAYVSSAVRRGLNVDDFAPRLSFFFNAHNDFFEEVAKFRAARRMWAQIMKERFGAKDEKSLQLRFHTQTGGSTLTAQQPDNNVVRVTLQALAAVLGGTQSLHTNSRDEALALPTEESARIALRTQQIIAHESGVANTVDPLGGSYYVESLTDEIERRAWQYIAKIDEMGGAVEAIEQGYMQREIHQAAYLTQQAIERGEQVVVGVNRFRSEGELEPELLRVDPALAQEQAQRLAKWRANRSQADCDAALVQLRDAAQGEHNLMPLIVQAVRARATTGEICDAMRDVFGEYRPQVF
ncbi:methylmalonyl-CoA mutase family protein [Alicyclobacillus fastidiosus]|uniref:Methylmalonyl-CoA mutase family protein n=1 Tax=Alicyclobacillus fastidiosus TaxID=392011 RepID=A0ABY6ZNC7_9BACL|nr:methylmalonyl-CoA mutase family protein [Alicyclobacillus fastidiosus]WAH44337.1 methylmalonyl-CoA mutase family protein [Alicyclobacillus fastidiosus]GMA60667.1 methylmalonyl-CoA mutase [Alicyclobacillus fastidiosus]